jgi:hypothetical protein
MVDKIGNPRNRLIEVEGADHSTISMEKDYSLQVIQGGIEFFDSLVAEKRGVSNGPSMMME